MSPVARRILIYWLLLLVPTLVAGVGALILLRREEARLETQASYASESRRAALLSRAGLIVENIELLVGDVQGALLDTAATLPRGNLPAELDRWVRENPLVRAAFLAERDGALRHVAAGDSEEAAGFRRRMAAEWGSGPPWAAGRAKFEEKDLGQQFSADGATRDEQEVRSQVTSNVAKVQSARRDAQLLARSAESAAYSPSSAGSDVPVTGQAPGTRGQAGANVRGWAPWVRDGRLHVVGWVHSGDAVVGLEVETSALIARLAAALPGETGTGQGFAILDDRGRIMHQAGFVPRDLAALSDLPIASGILPGWRVAAYAEDAVLASSGGLGFFLLGTILVGILIVAILAGGSLLFWQARRSEAEAAQKTSFVANVSHEFKTPLTTIRLYSELLEHDRVKDASRRTEYLRTIGRETQRLARLVGNVLDFSRLEQGKKKFAREMVDLRGELARLAEMHAPRFAENGLRLQLDLPDQPVELTTDRDACEQIVLNLLDNAAKYGAAGREITLRLERAAVGARVSVLDRGPGVPAEHRERIFEKFHRVDDALTAEQGGAGLGLSIARQLARGLGGDLRYAPREGGGAAFILQLP